MTFAQLMAEPVNIEPTAYQRGYAHGLRDKPWVPRDWDTVVDYSCGYANGKAERACRIGEMGRAA